MFSFLILFSVPSFFFSLYCRYERREVSSSAVNREYFFQTQKKWRNTQNKNEKKKWAKSLVRDWLDSLNRKLFFAVVGFFFVVFNIKDVCGKLLLRWWWVPLLGFFFCWFSCVPSIVSWKKKRKENGRNDEEKDCWSQNCKIQKRRETLGVKKELVLFFAFLVLFLVLSLLACWLFPLRRIFFTLYGKSLFFPPSRFPTSSSRCMVDFIQKFCWYISFETQKKLPFLT